MFTMLIGFLCISLSAQVQTQLEKEKVLETVSRENIEGHIYFLADDLLKGRATGTPELKIAASYLANSFRRYGVKPNPKTGTYYQDVPLQMTMATKNMKLELNSQEIEHKVAIEAAKLNYTGEILFLNFGLEGDYQGKDVKNKLLMVKAGKEGAVDARSAFRSRSEKANLAKKAGAAGIIELIDLDKETWEYVIHNFNSNRLGMVKEEESAPANPFVYLWVLDAGGAMTQSMAASKKVQGKLNMEAEKTQIIISQNVIGVVEGTDPQLKNEYIIYSAHYDHVGIGEPDESGDSIYNGARDNAVGTTTVLNMAENLAKYPTKRSALFILFTGEEKGLLGSNYYVENPVLPLENMVFCFNSDNAGYNDTTVATIIGLDRTTAASHIREAATTFGITAIDDPAPEQGLFDRSDNVHFASKGIPAPTFSLGFRAFDGDVTKYYHRPGDEAHTLDYDYLLKFFKAYVLSGRLIANDPKTPFWTPGDTYEPAGKKLYTKK